MRLRVRGIVQCYCTLMEENTTPALHYTRIAEDNGWYPEED
jgi:hypothetical protein